MVSSNKPKEDFLKAKHDREVIFTSLNQSMPSFLRFERRHTFLQCMPINKKVKNNKLENRIKEVPLTKAMGLSYILTMEGSKLEIPIQIFLSKSIYLKVPSDYKEDWKGYLRLLHNLNYHFIVADPKNNKFSFPIPINVFIARWSPSLCSSKGNRNRITFHGAAFGNCMTKKGANSRLLSYHFLKEQGISSEQLTSYCKRGRLNPSKK